MSSSDLQRKKFDIVIFGASGFTGQYVVEEVARTIGQEKRTDGKPLTWAIAGRDMKRLQKVLATASRETGVNISELPIIIADVKSESSLNEMCQQATVIINCVGPYRFFGTPVVKACIENKAHHIDICGEPAWLEQIDLVYSGKAKEAGVYVLEACGFDSIPSEMGVVYTRQQFNGTLNSVECYISMKPGNDGGARLNFGTWQSAIYGISQSSELRTIRRQLHASHAELPKSKYRMTKRSVVFYSDLVRGWCLPFLGADKSIVYRTTVHNFEHRKQSPIEFQPYLRCGSLCSLICMMFAGIVFGLFTKCRLGRYILETYPRLMSFGYCSKTGPTRKQIATTSCRLTFLGLGSEKKSDGEAGVEEKPTKKITTSLVAPEPGYVTTPICVVQAAYVLLSEKDKLPQGGGVYTPGAAFCETSLLSRLQNHNIQFSVVDK